MVSVFTATYDGEAFVAETIESVLAQTYDRVEHVLVDDASSDRTAEIVAEYERRYSGRIRLVQAPDRAGPCRRRNDAIRAANGSLLAWLDHDDVWLPQKLQLQVEALEAHPKAALCYSQYEQFDHKTGATIYRSTIPRVHDTLEQLFTGGSFIASSTAVFRRSEFHRHGGSLRDSDFSFGDDYSLWLALVSDRQGLLVDEVTVRLRRHARNESTRLGTKNYELAMIGLLDEFADRYPEGVRRLGRARRRGYARRWAAAAEWELRNGKPQRAAWYALRGAALDPTRAARYVSNRLSAKLARRAGLPG